MYFDEDYANGRIEELRDMKITDIGVYYESKCEQDIKITILSTYYNNPEIIYLREIAERIDKYDVSQRILVCESFGSYLDAMERFAKK